MKQGIRRQAFNGTFAGLTALCTMVYFVSYLTRINLGAVMVDMVDSGFASKAAVALALSVCSVTYGVGQIVNGYLCDRTKPQHVILVGLILTAAMNLGVFLLQDAKYLVALWAVNGLGQSCMWPPLVAILASHFEMEDYDRACVWVCWGSALGTIAVYLLSPWIIERWNYRWVFFCSGCLAIGMSLIWALVYGRAYAGPGRGVSGKKEEAAASAPKQHVTGSVLLAMGTVMLAIVMQGMLRDGVTNWMPTLVSETLEIAPSAAIFSGVLLPIFQMLCTKTASWLHRHWIRNERVCAAAVFLIGSVTALLLALAVGRNAVGSVVLVALLVGCMHGVNYLLLCLTPAHFFRYGRVGLISGVLNASTYIGSAVSTYGIAVFSERFGWRSTIVLWAAIALAGALLCVPAARNKELDS